jgi:hypothetical protein
MTVDVVAGAETGSLCLDADEKGSLLRPFELQVRNPTTEPVGPLHFHLGDLRSPEGAAVPSSILGFEPSTIEEVPSGTSHCVTMTLSFLEPLLPGVYRSVIQIAGAPDLSIPLHLSVHRVSS